MCLVKAESLASSCRRHTRVGFQPLQHHTLRPQCAEHIYSLDFAYVVTTGLARE